VALDPYIGGHALTVTTEDLNLSNMTVATAVISVSDSTDRHHSPSAAPSAALLHILVILDKQRDILFVIIYNKRTSIFLSLSFSSYYLLSDKLFVF
jgi:ABC-type microcin C transport system permease subunit YejE